LIFSCATVQISNKIHVNNPHVKKRKKIQLRNEDDKKGLI